MADPVLFEKRGHVAIFTLNRPEAMNAVNLQMCELMEKYLAVLEEDDDLWIGILESSHEKVFCAGADLKGIAKGEPALTKKGHFAGFVVYPRTKPMIAAIDGSALAGGTEITCACDLVVASSKAEFGVTEVKRSLIPAGGALWRLPRKIPENVAREMILTGDPISVERAFELGIVNVVAEAGRENVLNAALALAERITVNAPLAVREAKICIDEATSRGLDRADLKRSNMGFLSLAKTPDFKEGPKAFAEKRPPRWTGKRSAL